MRAVTNLFAAVAVAGALVAAVPAAAQSFSFTSLGDKGSLADGAKWDFASTTDANFKVTASAWTSYNGSIYTAKLGIWGGGLGVTSVTPYENGNNGTHTVDNNGAVDFILLQFDRAVNLTGGTFNAYDVQDPSTRAWSRDTDAAVYWGSFAGNRGAITSAQIAPAMKGYVLSPGTSASGYRSVDYGANGTPYGNLWLVAASSVDSTYDGFKLGQVNVTVPIPGVPEPATWGMMILGFGAIGSAMRRKRRAEAKTAVAA